jgi:hypothetical protein
MTEVSKTETALLALYAVLGDALAAAGFAAPMRNETVDVLLENIGNGSRNIVNLIDGNGDLSEEMLGAEAQPGGYEIDHKAEIEGLIANPDPEQRDADFDRLWIVIDNAIAADRTLAGVVDGCFLAPPFERSNPRTDGIPGVKYAVVTVALQFTSTRIF